MNNEVYFLNADKHLSLLQVDTIILGVYNHTCKKFPPKEVCIFLQYLQKSMEDESYFLHAGKQKFSSR